MARVQSLYIENYRSIREPVNIRFPKNGPLVLIGENNAGKSNIVRALDLILGETWPGNHDPEEHEYFGRDKANVPIQINVRLSGLSYDDRYDGQTTVTELTWRLPSDDGRPFGMTLATGKQSPYVSNEIREQCPCVVVGADRRLSYQLSYTSKYTLLSKLMRKFHQALSTDTFRMGELQKAFEEIKTLFQGVGEFDVFTQELSKQVDELSGNLEYGLGIDFSAYDPSNYFRALRVHPYDGDQVRTFEELGTGQEQILALSFAHAYAKAFHEASGLLLVIEEPEAHLHPLAQEWISRKVHELAREDVQIVVTTHSPAFLDIRNIEGFALVRKQENATCVVQLTPKRLAEYCQQTGATGATAESILPFYAAAATEEILSGLFARKIVLVEGPTESMALPAYLRRAGLKTMREGIAVIPVHGVGNLAKWWRLFTAFGIPTYVIFDNDADDDQNGNRRSDILRALGIPEDSISGLLESRDWIVEDEFCIFGVNYEATMQRYFPGSYEALEREARDTFGLSARYSKPLVARYVSEKLSGKDHPDGRSRIVSLAEKIRELRARDSVDCF